MGMVAIGCAISTYGKGCSDARARERGSPSAVSCARQDGSRRVVCTLCTVHCTDANGTLLYSLVLTYSTDETHGETMYEAVRYLLLTLRLSFHEPLLLSAGRSGSGLWTRVWRPAHCSHDGQRGQRGWPRGGTLPSPHEVLQIAVCTLTDGGPCRAVGQRLGASEAGGPHDD